MKKIIFAIACLLPFVLPLQIAAATFRKLYVFGDSNSDPGNIFNISVAFNQLDPTQPIQPPSPPYYLGRFSNGPIWVEYLGDSLNLNSIASTQLVVGSPITITPPGINFLFNGATTTQGVNFSFAGATSSFNNLDSRLPGVLTEIKAFTDDLALNNESADSEALYIVWAAGLNDFRAGNLDPTIFANNVANGVQSLYQVGARNIMVVNSVDIGKIPFSSGVYGTEVTNAYNSSLASTLPQLIPTLPDINLILFDANTVFQNAYANPSDFGFTSTTTPCFDDVLLTICSDQDSYLFWDRFHFSTAFHQILARAAFTQLDVLPLP